MGDIAVIGLVLSAMLAVGGCETVPHGRLEVLNRTTSEVTVSSMDGSGRGLVVQACSQGHLDDFPLWHIRVESPTSPNGYITGAEIGRQVLLLGSDGPVAMAQAPDPLPPCISPLGSVTSTVGPTFAPSGLPTDG
jgi:hypothetical protein